MGEVRRYHHGDLRRQLIAAAWDEVEEHGAENVVLTRLAQTCGVSVAAPYRHFPSKEALLGAVATQGFEELGLALTHAAAACDDPRDRLLAAGVAYVRFALAHRHLFKLMFNAELRTSIGDAGEASLGILVTLVKGTELAVPLDVAVRAAWAQVHGYASLCVGAMPAFSGLSDELIRDDFEVVLGGMLNRG